MKIFGHIVFTAITIVLFGYLLLPNLAFPEPPPDSVQSLEEADIETPLRRAYLTNFTREEVLEHYQRQIPWPAYRLNYPPEEAFVLIRDQARSTFLQEIVHPFRASLFVNGFEPKDPKDDVWYKGVDYRQKITVRYVPSSAWERIPIMVLTLLGLYLVSKEIFNLVFKFFKR